MHRRRIVRWSAGLLAASARPELFAINRQTPLRIIVTFLKNGSADIITRILTPELSKVLARPVAVDNIAGAGGTVGMQAMVQAAPDGDTLCLASVSTTGTGPIVRRVLSYDPLVDLVPVIKLVDVPGVIAVNPSFPADDYASFNREVQANPGKYSYASSGAGGVGHMAMELFKIRNRLYMLHIPYRSIAPGIQEVLSGRVPIIWDNLSSSLPHILSGRMNAIGLVGESRSPQLPALPTFGELGLRTYHATTYFGLLAPKGIPTTDVLSLNGALNAVLANPDVRDELIAAGGIPVGGSPNVLREQIQSELTKWGEVAVYTKVKV